MKILHECVNNELCGQLKTMQNSRNTGRALKTTHNFVNYNVFLSIALIMTSLWHFNLSVQKCHVSSCRSKVLLLGATRLFVPAYIFCKIQLCQICADFSTGINEFSR